MTTHHANRKDALEHLERHALDCVTWFEGNTLMSAIYWSGKRRIQPADKPVNTVNGKVFAQQSF